MNLPYINIWACKQGVLRLFNSNSKRLKGEWEVLHSQWE